MDNLQTQALTNYIQSVLLRLSLDDRPSCTIYLSKILLKWTKSGGMLPKVDVLLEYIELSKELSPSHFKLAWLELLCNTLYVRELPENVTEGYRLFRMQFEVKYITELKKLRNLRLECLNNATYLEGKLCHEPFLLVYFPVKELSRFQVIAKNLKPNKTIWLTAEKGGILLSFDPVKLTPKVVHQAFKWSGYTEKTLDINLIEYPKVILLSTLINDILPNDLKLPAILCESILL